MDKKHSSTYRTLDLVRASSFGWSQHHSLTAYEYQVLQFIALRGRSNEPGVAYAWFPAGGQEWWGDIMAIPHGSIRKALYSLRKKGLLVVLRGSANDTRFMSIRGYAIPVEVMEECQKWYIDRQEMVYTRIPNTAEEMFSTGKNEAEMFPQEHECSPTEHGCSHGNICNALTCGFPLHTHINTQEKPEILTDVSRPSVAQQEGNEMKESDGWDAPKERADDFEVPREAKEKPARTYGPNRRLLDHFYKRWAEVRERRLNLPVCWSVKVIASSNMKSLLSEYSEEQIYAMIDAYYRMVESGQVSIKADDMWRDFWYNRSKAYRIVAGQQVTEVDSSSQQKEQELQRFRQRLNR